MTKKRIKYDAETRKKMLQDGAKDEFWLMIRDRIEERRDYIIGLINDILDADTVSSIPAEQYKITLEVLRAMRNHLTEMRDLPETLVREIGDPGDKRESMGFLRTYDPYHT